MTLATPPQRWTLQEGGDAAERRPTGTERRHKSEGGGRKRKHDGCSTTPKDCSVHCRALRKPRRGRARQVASRPSSRRVWVASGAASAKDGSNGELDTERLALQFDSVELARKFKDAVWRDDGAAQKTAEKKMGGKKGEGVVHGQRRWVCDSVQLSPLRLHFDYIERVPSPLAWREYFGQIMAAVVFWTTQGAMCSTHDGLALADFLHHKFAAVRT